MKNSHYLSLAAFSVGVGLSVLWLAGCGQPLCVGGIGDCDVMTRTSRKPGTSSGSLTVNANVTTVPLGTTATITVSGGSPPYDPATTPPGYGMVKANGQGSGSVYKYTFVPTDIPPSGVVTVTFSDGSATTLTGRLPLKVTTH
jgi:hypothetical protein